MSRHRPTLLALSLALALGSSGAASTQTGRSADEPRAVWIVRFAEPALASYADASVLRNGEALAVTSPLATGSMRLDVGSDASRAYLEELAVRREARLEAAGQRLGRVLEPRFVYETVLNGVALELSEDEAAVLGRMPGVAAIERERIEHLQDEASTAWVKAPELWSGIDGVASRGEGVVVGIIDSGINPSHPSFAAVSPVDGYVHANPKGQFLGLCASFQATCNNKLIGIWDFTTGSGDEEANTGIDLDGHGTHVAGTAVGNAVNIVRSFSGGLQLNYQIRGVAPRANVISYKACEDGCAGSWTLAALEQAVRDGVDVINYSIGGGNVNPWSSSGALAMLGARNAGIVVAVAAGNRGPDVGTVTSPSDAPWVLSVANTTHGRRVVNRLHLSGGGSPPPNGGVMVGQGFTAGTGPAPLARDLAHPLCSQGSGDQTLPVTGASNPWAPNRWSGQIVVCDRGVQARVAKSNNVRLSGGSGTVLLNTAAEGESTVADEHSIPTTHLGWADAQALLAWLGSGSGHQARIEGAVNEIVADNADNLSSSSGRGPSPVLPTVIKPDLAAPGSNIQSASHQGNGDASLSGTSMASPHVAGAAALLRGAKPAWRADEIISALMGSARPGVKRPGNGRIVAANEQGAGVIDLSSAVRVPLAFRVPAGQFAAGSGAPANLNLPSMVFDNCNPNCGTLSRTVSDLVGGAAYTATFSGAAGVDFTIHEPSFDVASGASRTLQFSARIADPGLYGRWVHGRLTLRRVGGITGEQVEIPVAFRAPVTGLPAAQFRTVDSDRGHFDVALPGLNLASPNARFAGTALVPIVSTSYTLGADPTPSDRYDNLSNGVGWHAMTAPFPATANATRYRIEVELESPSGTTASLLVGNGGGPGSRNQICESTTRCVLEVEHHADSGSQAYWAMVWNRTGSGTFTVKHSVLALAPATSADPAKLTVTGPGSAGLGEASALRVGWHDLGWAVGEERRGALLVYAAPGLQPMGAVPYTLTRVAGARAPVALAPITLAPARSATLRLGAGESHESLFVDVPPGTLQLRVEMGSSANMDLYLARRDFNAALPSRPMVPSAPARGEALHSATGPGGNESLTISNPAAGRWYLTPVNAGAQPASVTVSATLVASPPLVRPGGYLNTGRSGHGVFLYPSGSVWAGLWYTYVQDGTPTWYYLQGPLPDASGIWRGGLFRAAWNGTSNHLTEVGQAIATPTGADAFTWTWTLDGQTGSEPMSSFGRGCPTVGGVQANASGHWFDDARAGTGYSVQLFPNYEFHAVFGYDARGVPRFLLAERSGIGGESESLRLDQVNGFCPMCDRTVDPSRTPVGSLERRFVNGVLTGFALSGTYAAGVSGTWAANDAVEPLGGLQGCQP